MSLSHAKSLFEKAKDFSNRNSKESYVKQAYGAAVLAANLGESGAQRLLSEIENYAREYNIDL